MEPTVEDIKVRIDRMLCNLVGELLEEHGVETGDEPFQVSISIHRHTRIIARLVKDIIEFNR